CFNPPCSLDSYYVASFCTVYGAGHISLLDQFFIEHVHFGDFEAVKFGNCHFRTPPPLSTVPIQTLVDLMPRVRFHNLALEVFIAIHVALDDDSRPAGFYTAALQRNDGFRSCLSDQRNGRSLYDTAVSHRHNGCLRMITLQRNSEARWDIEIAKLARCFFRR